MGYICLQQLWLLIIIIIIIVIVVERVAFSHEFDDYDYDHRQQQQQKLRRLFLLLFRLFFALLYFTLLVLGFHVCFPRNLCHWKKRWKFPKWWCFLSAKGSVYWTNYRTFFVFVLFCSIYWSTERYPILCCISNILVMNFDPCENGLVTYTRTHTFFLLFSCEQAIIWFGIGKVKDKPYKTFVVSWYVSRYWPEHI